MQECLQGQVWHYHLSSVPEALLTVQPSALPAWLTDYQRRHLKLCYARKHPQKGTHIFQRQSTASLICGVGPVRGLKGSQLYIADGQADVTGYI